MPYIIFFIHSEKIINANKLKIPSSSTIKKTKRIDFFYTSKILQDTNTYNHKF